MRGRLSWRHTLSAHLLLPNQIIHGHVLTTTINDPNTVAPEVILYLSEHGVHNLIILASCLVDSETLTKDNNYFRDSRDCPQRVQYLKLAACLRFKWQLSYNSFLLKTANLSWWKDVVELVRNLVAHGDAREGKWRGNWRIECVASTLTPPPNVVYPALLKLMRTLRLPAVDWTDAPTDLNGLIRFGERRNLVSALVPSRSARAILLDH